MYYLLEEIFNKDISYFYAHQDELVDESKSKLLLEYAKRRIKKEPIEYILKKANFYGNEFYVDSNVLIPRNDTEVLVEKAITAGKSFENPKVLDLACGSGCIGISIAKTLKHCNVVLSDICDECIEIAKKNILINDVKSNCYTIKSDLFSKIEGKFDVIVSNPPYIPMHEYISLDKQVSDYEPKLALLAGDEGTEFYESISLTAKYYLNNKGYILFETGYNQAFKVAKILKKQGYSEIQIFKDMQGIDRIVIAKQSMM
ncbi:MAG TPA: peptide chain release factor N(5)-glutamine methyltransferase [Clostridia bacterium]|nr:peptide chain release factor N(5)-glutamine methyltransferase [Clostridia bacterium]